MTGVEQFGNVARRDRLSCGRVIHGVVISVS
jgi:hypothetical protein